MHLALNKIVEGRFEDDSPRVPIRTDLYFYAEEAYELGHTDDARRHYRAVIRYSVILDLVTPCILTRWVSL